jgi:hypothetical protein
MSRSKVTISSRELQELLAGRISHQEFLRSHRWEETDANGHRYANPFEIILAQGRMIEKINVEVDENDNDDWITFEFGNPDPSISPFVTHSKTHQKT